MNRLQDDVETIVHSLLYILKQLGGQAGFHKVFKIMYFADQKHLAKYGSPIVNEKYIAMKNGPVPSMAYDILKALRSEGLMSSQRADFIPYFTLINDHTVSAISDPDLDNLSQSEINALTEAINENKHLNFTQLTDKSHDAAWNNAPFNSEIEAVDIAKAAGASSDLVKYIKDHMENQYADFE